jgi:HlyD family secretion protein
MSTRKRLLLIAGAVALVAALVLAFRPRPERVETATVSVAPLLSTIDAEGVARVDEYYAVAAPVTGLVRRIPYEVGEPVRAGDAVAEIEPTPTQPLDARTRAEVAARVQAAAAAVRRTQSEAAAARTRAELTASTVTRMRPLAADSVLAPAEFDRYLAEARQAADVHASAEAAVDAARRQLQATQALLEAAGGTRGGEITTVTAPAPGVVLAVYHESEGVVTAGQPLVDIGDPGDLEVAADVLSEEASRLAPGMRALVETGGPTVEGHVRHIEPVAFTEVSALGVEEQRVNVIVDLPDASTDEAPLRLGHGYRVRVQFVAWEDANTLRVPTSALFETGDGWATFVVEDEEVHLRPVEIGHRAGLWAEVLGGLEAGDVVVTHPGDDLEDGARVSVAD